MLLWIVTWVLTLEQGCKAVVFSETGSQISFAYREYNIISKKDGWAELDASEVIEKCFQVIKESTTQAQTDPIKGIGISSQGEAFTMIDKEGKIICNAFVSSDVRAKEYAVSWAETFGVEKLYQVTGHTPHPMFSEFGGTLLYAIETQLHHHPWNGLRFWDLIQPFFMFIVGVAMPLSYGRRIKKGES